MINLERAHSITLPRSLFGHLVMVGLESVDEIIAPPTMYNHIWLPKEPGSSGPVLVKSFDDFIEKGYAKKLTIKNKDD